MLSPLLFLGACSTSAPPSSPGDPAVDHAVDTAVPAVDSTAPVDTGDTAAPVDTAPVDTAPPPDTGDPDDHEGSKALCVVTVMYDTYASGNYQRGYRSQVNAAGDLVLEAYLDGDGVEATHTTYTYDARENLLQRAADLEADGVVDVTDTYTYDSHDNLLTFESAWSTHASNYQWFHSYGASEELLLTEYDGYGDETDGVVDETLSYIYDDALRPTSEATDLLADGSVELTVSYAWDDDDRLLSEGWDYDGLVDAWGYAYEDYGYAFSYDADGNLLDWALDYGLDGAVDTRVTYTYDAGGHVLTQQVDYGDDGVLDGDYAYTYDARGNRLTYSVAGDDGVMVLRQAYTYDANDLLVADQWYDTEGNPYISHTWAFDEDLDLVRYVEYDTAGDPQYLYDVDYDCSG